MTISTPLSAREILDASFLENRARLLEIAAFLDRIGRAPGAEEALSDFRCRALLDALELLKQKENRTAAIQLCFSDPTLEPIESAIGAKGAAGAWKGRTG